MKFDKETEKWFIANPYIETPVMQCEECGLWYKPSLGHKCKKMAEAQEKGKGKKWEVT